MAEPALAAAARVIDERHRMPWATLGISALTFPSVDTAPFGFGLRPPASALGRVRNRAIGGSSTRRCSGSSTATTT